MNGIILKEQRFADDTVIMLPNFAEELLRLLNKTSTLKIKKTNMVITKKFGYYC